MRFCAAGAIWWRGKSAPAAKAKPWRSSGRRLKRDPAEIRALLDDPARMDRCLWRHVPKTALAKVERDGYAYAREQLAVYLAEFAPAFDSA